MKEKSLAVWEWLVYSSANSQKISLSVKGGLMFAIPYIVGLAPLVGITTDSVGLGELAQYIADLVGVALTMVGGVAMAMGLVRKIIIKLALLKK